MLLAGTVPVLGVCLGMQGLVTAHSGNVVQDLHSPAHGEIARIDHDVRIRGPAAGLRGREVRAGGARLLRRRPAILGRDAEGGPVVDSPIVIRTADVDLDGRITVTAGATLVRDSDPASEVAVTHAKAGGILSGDVHVVRGPHYRGIQFHAESILTEHGYDLIHNLVRELLAG